MTVGRENQEMISKTRTMFMGTYLFVFGTDLTKKKRVSLAGFKSLEPNGRRNEANAGLTGDTE